MGNRSLKIISVGYAKQALRAGTREHERILKYASVLGEMHMIVFTRSKEGFPDFQKIGNLSLYATNNKTKIGMLWKAILIGREIINKDINNRFIVSSQDPFETSLVGRMIVYGNSAIHHVQVHGDVFNPLSYQTSILNRLRFFYGKAVVRSSASIRVVSERIKKTLLLLKVPEEHITVLPIQADLESFLKIGEERVYRKRDSVSFLYVGRFSPEKNLIFLVKAFSCVALEYKHISLTLIGDGPTLANIKKEIHHRKLENQIILKPWTKNVAREMGDHDVFCLSSDHEGWGMVMLEAAGTGMPVLTTDVGCAGELILNKKHGIVIRVGDLSGYVSALRQFIINPELISEYGFNGKKMANAYKLPEIEYLKKIVDAFPSF